ncbi:MAG: adenosine deaminase [Anaerolineae bacterium]
MDLNPLPKVELHLHLDCSLSYDVVSELRPSVTRGEYERDFIAPAKCTNLADFLSRAPAGIALMQTERALERVVEDLLRQLRADGVIYAELRFAPLLHTRAGLGAEEVVEIVERAMDRASRASGVEARLILCTLRHFSQAQSLRTVRLVERFQGARVVALDLAADEAGFPLEAHIPAFRYAIERDIPRIAHAGEARGPDSVWETLRQLQPARLGHGVRSIEDPALLDHLKAREIHLELCPSCNVQIDIYDTYADHPIDRLYAAGLSVGVSTDGRTLTGITLTQEYERLRQAFGWGMAHFLQCNLNALRAAFVPAAVRQRLERRLVEGYGVTVDS